MDESHFDNKTARRRRGRSRVGTPVIEMSFLGQDTNSSLLAAMTCRGIIPEACVIYEGGINHEVLCEWAEEHLLPNLPPASYLVLDNAAIHHHDDFIALLEAK